MKTPPNVPQLREINTSLQCVGFTPQTNPLSSNNSGHVVHICASVTKQHFLTYILKFILSSVYSFSVYCFDCAASSVING